MKPYSDETMELIERERCTPTRQQVFSAAYRARDPRPQGRVSYEAYLVLILIGIASAFGLLIFLASVLGGPTR